MRVFYDSRSEHAHHYQCRGDDAHVGAGLCIGIGGVAVDKAIAVQLLEAVSGRAVDAAILAAEQGARVVEAVRRAVEQELEKARYAASLAERRYEHVDPAKRPVARALPASDEFERAEFSLWGTKNRAQIGKLLAPDMFCGRVAVGAPSRLRTFSMYFIRRASLASCSTVTSGAFDRRSRTL